MPSSPLLVPFLLLLQLSPVSTLTLGTLYDIPVSNHGARVRYLLHAKGLLNPSISSSSYDISPPSALGGLKSPSYLALNPAGKMPLLVCGSFGAIPESDTICRHLVDKHISLSPSFIPETLELRTKQELIVRSHDQYITPIQAAMYRAPGTVFAHYGTDRQAALTALLTQLDNIESSMPPDDKSGDSGSYMCGKYISLADITVFPTVVFSEFMLPRFFGVDTGGRFPKTQAWFEFMSGERANPVGKRIREEMTAALEGWEEGGRWDPILEEIKSKRIAVN